MCCFAQLTDTPERNMLQLLMCTPALCSLVPRYSQDIPLSHWEGREPQEDSVCVELQDLTAGFGDSPCVMDIKVGIRTFLEDEVSNPKLRPDLLKKMDKLDPSAATAEEREHVRHPHKLPCETSSPPCALHACRLSCRCQP